MCFWMSSAQNLSTWSPNKIIWQKFWQNSWRKTEFFGPCCWRQLPIRRRAVLRERKVRGTAYRRRTALWLSQWCPKASCMSVCLLYRVRGMCTTKYRSKYLRICQRNLRYFRNAAPQPSHWRNMTSPTSLSMTCLSIYVQLQNHLGNSERNSYLKFEKHPAFLLSFCGRCLRVLVSAAAEIFCLQDSVFIMTSYFARKVLQVFAVTDVLALKESGIFPSVILSERLLTSLEDGQFY